MIGNRCVIPPQEILVSGYKDENAVAVGNSNLKSTAIGIFMKVGTKVQNFTTIFVPRHRCRGLL